MAVSLSAFVNPPWSPSPSSAAVIVSTTLVPSHGLDTVGPVAVAAIDLFYVTAVSVVAIQRRRLNDA